MNYLDHRRNLKLGLVKKEDKKPTPIPKKSAKKIAQKASEKKERGGQYSEMVKWYGTIMQNEKPICWETGEKIEQAFLHASVSHLLPKALFPSVATHKNNYAILSAANGSHGKYDLSWESAAKMKIWPYALKVIVKELVPRLSAEERRRLPDVIQQELDPLK